EPPTADKLLEANRLLNTVVQQRPALEPVVDYWRAVAQMHAKQPEQAAYALSRGLDPQVHGKDQEHRQSVLLRAGQLAITGPQELRRRVGQPQLQLSGRRMEAIAEVERRLAEVPDDPAIWGLKRVLYQDLTEADYVEGAKLGIPEGSF